MPAFLSAFSNKKAELLAFVPLLLFYAFSYFQRTAIPGTIFNTLQADLHLSALMIAGIGASFIYVYGMAQFVIGLFVDQYGGMRVLTAGGILFCLGAILTPFAGNIWAIYAARALAGLGASTVYLSIVREADHTFGRKSFSFFLGIIYFVGYGGGLIGTLPFELLCRCFHYKTILIWAGALSIAVYFLMLCGKRHIPATAVNNSAMSMKSIFSIMKNPYTWRLTFCAVTNFAIYFVIQTVFGKKFLQDRGMDSGSAAFCIFLLTLVSMAVLFSSGLISSLTHNKRKPGMIAATSLCLASSIGMCVFIAFDMNAWWFCVCYCLYAVVAGFATMFYLAMQEVNSAKTMAFATGFVNGASYLTSAIASVLVGIYLDAFRGAAKIVENVIIYPKEAYLSLFLILLIPATLSFLNSLFIPETRGHFLHR